MKIITSREIEALDISPSESVEWVRQAFLMKDRCQLPPKISLHPQGNDFINTMPSMLPEEFHTFGCKVVSRIRGTTPALKSEMMMFNTLTGEMTALINAEWITARRTGAVAALAINTLRSSNALTYSFIGLGVIARATLDCVIATNKDKKLIIRLKKYKDQAEKIILEYQSHSNVEFEVCDTMEELVRDSDVIVSCITDADGLLVEDVTLFKPGVLVVPVHTRGFQNCDIVFDKVFADDEGHVKGFKYFSQFKKFGELYSVLKGLMQGRANDEERILSYNIGIGIHDVFFAYNIIQLIDIKRITPPYSAGSLHSHRTLQAFTKSYRCHWPNLIRPNRILQHNKIILDTSPISDTTTKIILSLPNITIQYNTVWDTFYRISKYNYCQRRA